MKQAKSISKSSKNLIREVVREAKQRQQTGQVPFTYYYKKCEKFIASFFCADETNEFVLFFCVDFHEPALILELIAEHCYASNEEFLVYPLTTKAFELYETVTPENFLIVEIS
ncbi:hypothetical protein [Gloeothece verrucosa]|uniref:Uncharacterized protein n=1 Tax=Gloeothece verrucosa (strain PCC 7822) TaxID=497965 RepID=E0UKU7_GLOV7|nr:hypothetical protein [Gloeothece verrucosa]ADN17577.1 hypothetical protein Cyan7822_5716 [Gloeothece verrucosa PCC 7822]